MPTDNNKRQEGKQQPRQHNCTRIASVNCYLHSSSSHCKVWMFISMVRLALVTSVMWRPPLTPPVKFHSSHESTVPNMHRPAAASSRTVVTLSINQRNFTALKYVDSGSPHKRCSR